MPFVFMLLIVKQPDLGTALVLFGVTAVMLWLAGSTGSGWWAA